MPTDSNELSQERFYPIGTPGRPWGALEREEWRLHCCIQRSYQDEVLTPLKGLDASLDVEAYGALSIDPKRYPLLVAKSLRAGERAPWVLITGGVHGYETSGVQGALAFLSHQALAYSERVNLVVAPCVSPWAYEAINRWNPQATDPNRSFVANSPSEECAALMEWIAMLGVDFLMHLDLHETTDTDESEFRPALAARDGKPNQTGLVPDGFYTVGDSENPQAAFQAAIIAGVDRVTHIAPADAKGEIIGAPVTQRGVINYPFKKLGLCAGVTAARFASTTEVYPDSPRATAGICKAAQVAAIVAALDHAFAH